MAFARSLLHAGEHRAWSVLWPVIQSDANFGKSLLEGASYGRSDGASFSAGLSEDELEALYIWLVEHYPPSQDRQVSGAVGPVDTIRFLRDGTLEVLKVVIEVKGSWNDGLMLDMERQLRDRYLRNSNSRNGLYVTAYFNAATWSQTDNRRVRSGRRDLDELREQLASQALALSGSVSIRSFVLDASLDSTAASEVFENRGES